MCRYSNIYLLITALFLLISFGSRGVCAQPLGIMSPQKQQISQHKLLSSANGRYVFGQISDSSKGQFMLDTYSGRLWRIAETGKIGIYLKPVPYRTEEGKCFAIPSDTPDIKPKKTGKKRETK